MARGVAISEAMAKRWGLDARSAQKSPKARTVKARVTKSADERAIDAMTQANDRATNGKFGRMTLPETSDFSIVLDMPIEPKTKSRHRHVMPYKKLLDAFRASQVNGRRSESAFMALVKKIHIHSYTEDETASFEDAVRTIASAAMRGRAPCSTPVEAVVQFRLTGEYLELPTDTTDPDIDNMTKAVFDGLNRVVYVDDRLVCWKTITKACDAVPSIRVMIRAVSINAPVQTGRYDLLPSDASSSIP